MISKEYLDGRIKLYQGDFFEIAPTIKCDVILEDPPYKFEAHGRGIAKCREKTFGKVMKNIGCDSDTDVYTPEFFDIIKACCKDVNYFNFCNKAQLPDLLNYAVKNKLCFDVIPLCKENPTPFANNVWLMDREFGVHIHKNFHPHSDIHYRKGWFSTNNAYSHKIDHPSPKPLFVIESILLNISKKDDVVFDGFVGSGTTAIACIKNNRRFVGCEILKEYFDLSCQRIEEELAQINMFKDV